MSIIASRERSRTACPLCGGAPLASFQPFCSQGCRDRDLLNWLGDAYRVPGAAADPDRFENAAAGLDTKMLPPL